MEYRVIRGSNQIGGTVTEIVSKKGTRIWVDFGAELSVDEEESTDKRLIDLMNSNEKPDAVFFTHIHGDHIGLLDHVPKGVHIYIGKTSIEMLENIQETLLNLPRLKQAEREKLQKEYDLLHHPQFTHVYKKGELDHFKDIDFIAVDVDHSVYDAYMLRFDVDGESLVHTGDFRDHGRLGNDIYDKLKDKMGSGISYLVTEGTMMSRLEEEVMTEPEMEKKAEEILQNKKYGFLVCSSTNMESLASFYHACVNTGKTFYCNAYVKRQLDLYTKVVGSQNDHFRFEKVEVIEGYLEDIVEGKSQYDQMIEDGFVMLVGKTKYYRKLMEKFAGYDEDMVLLYSMWEGYIQRDKKYTNPDLLAMIDWWEDTDADIEKLHTSGHATAKAIGKMITDVFKPTKGIIPIHTENAKGFQSLEIDEKYKKLIKYPADLIDDGKCEIDLGDGNILRVSGKVKFTMEKEKFTLFMEHPTENMQTDAAAFEGIIAAVWSCKPNLYVELGFDKKMDWDGKFPLPNYADKKGAMRVKPEWLHYMRFLYRVWRFTEYYKSSYPISIAEECKEEVDKFAAVYQEYLEVKEPEHRLCITQPDTKKSGLKKGNVLEENHLEKWFVMNSVKQTMPESITGAFTEQGFCFHKDISRLFDQMPCRLFVDEKSEANKIFNSGFFDLWGVDEEGCLSIFELKKAGNEPLGIVSELFFYAMIARDMRIVGLGEKSVGKRGINEFLDTKEKDTIKAYFLAPRLHYFLEKHGIVNTLNIPGGNIKFGNISFDQQEIVGEDVGEFLAELRKDWEEI